MAQLFGELPVDGFFALSGFLITASWMKRRSTKDYALSRFLRIMPGFWVCQLVVAFVVAPLGMLLATKENQYSIQIWDSIQYFAVNGALWIFQYDIGGSPTGIPYPHVWNGPLWTLAWEALCYIGIAVLGLMGVLRFKVTVPALIGAAWILSLATTLLDPISYMAIAGRFSLMFLCGALVFQLQDRIKVSVLAMSGCAVGIAVGVWLLPNYRLIAAPLLAYLVICLGALIKARALRCRNDLSYGMYIYALPVQQMIMIVGGEILSLGIYIAASIGGAAVLAAASWVLVERPATRLKRRLLPSGAQSEQLISTPTGEELTGGAPMHVVLVTDDAVYPAVGGGKVEIAGEVAALRRAGHFVHLVVSHRQPIGEASRTAHHLHADWVTFLARSSLPLTTLTHPLKPYQLASRHPLKPQQVMGEFRHPVDVVIASHDWTIELAHSIATQFGAPVLLRSHNDEITFMHALKHGASVPRRWYYALEAYRLRRLLDKLLEKVACVALLTDRDRPSTVSDAAKWRVLPPILDCEDSATEHTPRYHADTFGEILFIGSLDMPQTRSGLTWFATYVLPLVRNQRPGTVLRVAGRRCPNDVEEWLRSTEGIEFEGEVDDLEPLYARADVFVNPVFAGSGVNMKMLTPAVRRIPIVSTPVGVRGLDMLAPHVLLADSAGAFAESCMFYLNDDAASARAGAHLHQAVSDYSVAAASTRFNALLDFVLRRSDSLRPTAATAPRRASVVEG